MTLLWGVIHDFMACSFYMLLKSKKKKKCIPVLNYAIQHKRDMRSVAISAGKS